VLFLLACAAVGLADFYIGSQTALISSVAPSAERTRVLGRFRVSTDVGALVGPVLLAWVMQQFGPQSAMVLAAGLMIAVGLLSRVAILTEGGPDEADGEPANATVAVA
jgi:MFS family permease